MTFGAVAPRATSINEGVGATQNRATLLNLVRASRSEPLYFLSLTALHASSAGDLKVGLPAESFGPYRTPSQRNFSIGGGNTNVLDNSTTTSFDIGVLGSKDFYAGLLSPLGLADVDLLLHQGFSRELVFYLVIDKLKVTQVGPDGAPTPGVDPTVIYNDPSNHANFTIFQTYVRQAMIHGLTTESYTGERGGEGGKPPPARVQLCYERALATEDGKQGLVGSPNLCGGDLVHGGPRNAAVPLFVKLPDFRTGQMGNFQIEVTTRSIFGIFNYLGAAIAHGDQASLQLHDYQLPAERSDAGPILTVVTDASRLDRCFAAITYEREHYCVPEDGAVNTKRIFVILNTLMALKQSPGDLPLTQTVRIEP